MVGSKVTFAEPKTTASRRSIALDPSTVAALKTHRAGQAAERLAWGEAWTDYGLVFTREDGSPLQPATLTRTFARLADELGMPSLSLHGLRHSHVTALLRGGQPLRVVSARAGHSSPAVTLSVYAHVLPGDDEAAATAAASLFGD